MRNVWNTVGQPQTHWANLQTVVRTLNEDQLRGAFRVTDSSSCRSESAHEEQMDSLTSLPPSPLLLVSHVVLSWRQRALIPRRLLWLRSDYWLDGEPLTPTFILCFQMSHGSVLLLLLMGVGALCGKRCGRKSVMKSLIVIWSVYWIPSGLSGHIRHIYERKGLLLKHESVS